MRPRALGPHLLRRAAAAVALLFAVLTAAFFCVHALPGDPALLLAGPQPSPEVLDEIRRSFALDKPLPHQYARWLGSAARGDWGRSFRLGVPAMEYLIVGLRNTAILALPALLIQFTLGLGLGVAAGRRENRPADFAIRIGSVVLYALPIFWFAQMARLVVAYRWSLFPAGGMRPPGASGTLAEVAAHTALPALVLGLALTAHTTRLVRNHLVEIYRSDFIRTARAKGASERRVAWRHALRDALSPVTQSFGLTLALLLSGSVIVETIFSWPGLGRRLFLAVEARDLPVVLAGTALTAVLMILGNLIADLLQAAADPRIRT